MLATTVEPSLRKPRPDGRSAENSRRNRPSESRLQTAAPSWSENQNRPSRQRGLSGNLMSGAGIDSDSVGLLVRAFVPEGLLAGEQ
jgi:hypothetical protein